MTHHGAAGPGHLAVQDVHSGPPASISGGSTADADSGSTWVIVARRLTAGLVEPIGEEHMYHAAVRSKACGLTTLGKYYWRLVQSGRI